MTTGKLLDTNAVIALQAGDSNLLRFLETNAVILPCIVLGELYYGAQRSERTDANIAVIDDLAQSSAVLVCDGSTARFYGEIKNALRLKGRPIPENDIWIAALARQHSLTLITRDAHFDDIRDLSVARW